VPYSRKPVRKTRNLESVLKLGTSNSYQGTYTPLWGVSALLQKTCHSVQSSLEGDKNKKSGEYFKIRIPK
jgi:hypothetical protein